MRKAVFFYKNLRKTNIIELSITQKMLSFFIKTKENVCSYYSRS
jgi:uncharacterized membrane protein YoaT (DUF817 family)